MTQPTESLHPQADLASKPDRLSEWDRPSEAERLEAARRYVEQLQAFFVHAGVFAVGMVVILVVNVATNLAAGIADEWWAWWSVWAFIGWGAGIAVHGLVVRLNRPSSLSSAGEGSSTWQQRQIDKLLSK